MSIVNPVQGDWANTVYIDVSASSQRVQLTPPYPSSSYIVTNEGTATAYIATGGSTVNAANPSAGASSKPILSGSEQVLTFQTTSAGALYVAAVAAAATGKIYFTPVLNRTNGGL